MLYYEWKKTFTRRKIIIITALLSLVSIWTISETKILISIEDMPDPFALFVSYLGYLNIFMWLILIVVVSSLFPKELDTGMAPILQTSRYGRKEVAQAKLVLTLLFTNTLYILYVIVALLSYYFSWNMDFSIPIVEGYELEIAANPGIQTFGDIVLIQALGFFFEMNFLALFCLFLQQKLKTGFSTAVIIIAANFGLGLIPGFDIPILDQIISLLPMCFTTRPITYKVILHLGSFAVSPVHIGFVVYTILIVFLFIQVKGGFSCYGRKLKKS